MKVEKSYLPLYTYKIDLSKKCPLTMVKSVLGGSMHLFLPPEELSIFIKESFDPNDIFLDTFFGNIHFKKIDDVMLFMLVWL
jgi:hypothetical protein